MSDPNKNRSSDAEWLKTIQETLDDGIPLDDDVRQRLQLARREALRVAAGMQARRSRVTHWLVPAGGFAIVALAVVMGLVIGVGPAHNPLRLDQSSIASSEDLPMLTSPESLELYEELDFYQWLEEEQDRVG